MVSQKLVEELQIILREDYGKDLDIKEVSEIANGLIGYLTLATEIYARDEELWDKNKQNEISNQN